MYKAVLFLLEESNITIMFESSYVIHNDFHIMDSFLRETFHNVRLPQIFKTCSVNLFRGNIAPLFHSFKAGVPGKAAVTTMSN